MKESRIPMVSACSIQQNGILQVPFKYQTNNVNWTDMTYDHYVVLAPVVALVLAQILSFRFICNCTSTHLYLNFAIKY